MAFGVGYRVGSSASDSDEVDSDTHYSDPGNREELEHPVTERDLLGLPGLRRRRRPRRTAGLRW